MPTLRSTRPSTRPTTAVLVLAMVAALLALTVPARAGAAPATTVSTTATKAAAKADSQPDLASFPERCDKGVLRACRITYYADRPFLVLWGDSHALEYRAPVESLARERKVNLVLIFQGGCPLAMPFPRSSGEVERACEKHNVAALEHVRHLQATGRGVRLLLGSWWHFYRVRYAAIQREARTGVSAGLSPYARHIARLGATRSRALFEALGRSRIHADVIGQSGTVPASPPECPEGEQPYSCDLPRDQVLPNAASNAPWLRDRGGELAYDPRYIDTSPAYCDRATCYGMVWGHHTFYDRQHLGRGLTTRMRSMFEPSVVALLRQR